MKKTYKQYEEYKDSRIDWLGEVPKHWEVVPLKSTSRLKSITNCIDKDLLSVYLDKGVIKFDEVEAKRTNVTSLDLSKYQLVNIGDFVLNNQQAWRGSVGVSNYEGIVSPAYLVLTLLDRLNPIYANYLFRSPISVYQYVIASRGVGTIQRNLYYQQLKNFLLPLPPLPEQQRIADFLDRKTSDIDKAIAQKEELIRLLNERKQILINKAVTRGLDENVPLKNSGVEWIREIPEHWEVRKLKYCAKIVSTKMEAKNNELPYLGMENIESKTGRFIETESEAEGLANYFDKNNVLFGKLRPYLAKVYIAIGEGICSSEFLVYETLKSIVTPTHFKNLLLSPSFIQLIDSSTYGSKMPRANADYIGNQELPLPPLSEQQAISTFIEEQTTKIDRAITQKEEEISLLHEYKSSLIDSAVRGRICLV